MRGIVILAALLIGVFFLMGGIPTGEVVDGQTAMCFMGATGTWSTERGMEYQLGRCYGTFATWNSMGNIAIKNTAARLLSHTQIDADTCRDYGGIWEYESECYLPPDSFLNAGLDNLEVSEGTIGYTYYGEPTMGFYTVTADKILIKSTGFWLPFPSWDNIDPAFLAVHPHPDTDNKPVGAGGTVWVKLKTTTPPEEPPLPEPEPEPQPEPEPTPQPQSIFDIFFGFINGIFAAIGEAINSIIGGIV